VLKTWSRDIALLPGLEMNFLKEECLFYTKLMLAISKNSQNLGMSILLMLLCSIFLTWEMLQWTVIVQTASMCGNMWHCCLISFIRLDQSHVKFTSLFVASKRPFGIFMGLQNDLDGWSIGVLYLL